jgi:hypothetical protein
MLIASNWKPTTGFVPGAGPQRIIERYNPAAGAYQASYFNAGDPPSVLAGLRGLSGWDGLSPMVQAAIVVGVVGIGGSFGIKRYGSPKLKRLVGLAGARRRRRR